MSNTNLVYAPHVVLSEDAAQSLVDAVSCPSEAVLVAGPAPSRFGCAHQRHGERQKKHE